MPASVPPTPPKSNAPDIKPPPLTPTAPGNKYMFFSFLICSCLESRGKTVYQLLLFQNAVQIAPPPRETPQNPPASQPIIFEVPPSSFPGLLY